MVAFLATVAVAGLHAQKKFVMLDKVVAVVGSSAIMHSEVEDLANQIVEQRRAEGYTSDRDPMLQAAIETVVEAGMASTSLLQRKLKLGYARAARIMDAMEELHVIGPYEGSKPRAVLISRQQAIEMFTNGTNEEPPF